jgi:hypothetical protein
VKSKGILLAKKNRVSGWTEQICIATGRKGAHHPLAPNDRYQPPALLSTNTLDLGRTKRLHEEVRHISCFDSLDCRGTLSATPSRLEETLQNWPHRCGVDRSESSERHASVFSPLRVTERNWLSRRSLRNFREESKRLRRAIGMRLIAIDIRPDRSAANRSG